MDNNVRSSGIEGLGDMSWGTHFCLFYETLEDFLDILIPYLKVVFNQLLESLLELGKYWSSLNNPFAFMRMELEHIITCSDC